MAAKASEKTGPEGEQGPSLLDGLAGYQLRRASHRVMADFAATMGPLGLRPALFAMLERIRAQPGIIQMALGTGLGIQRANLVPLLNDLAGRGLVERRAAPNDRRAFALFLTQEGESLLNEAEILVREHEQRILAGLSAAERRQLLALLARVAAE